MAWWIGGIVSLAGVYITFPLVMCRYSLRRDSGNGIQPILAQIIRRFEWRAATRQCGSHAILVLILTLLAAAAWVFVQAKEITTRETSGDLSQKFSQATTKRDTDLAEQNRLRRALADAVEPFIYGASNEAGPGGPSMTIELLDTAGKIKETQNLSQELRNHPPIGTTPLNIRITLSGRRTNPSSGLSEPFQVYSFDRSIFDSDKLANASNALELKDVPSLINQYVSVQRRVEIDGAALSRLAYEINNSEVAKATGEEPPPEAPGNLSLPFLLQLNITRFGTITLASIAIGILVPLYRFSERLAAFYRARSDALRLHQIPAYKTIGIVRLSTMLTPTIDYGKSQNMPDNLVEMLQLVARTEQEK